MRLLERSVKRGWKFGGGGGMAGSGGWSWGSLLRGGFEVEGEGRRRGGGVERGVKDIVWWESLGVTWLSGSGSGEGEVCVCSTLY